MNCFKNKKWLGGVWLGMSLAYPFLIYFFSDAFSITYLMVGMISLCLLRAFYPLCKKPRSLMPFQKRSLFLAVFVTLLVSGLYFWKGAIAPLLYPVIMSLGVAVVFGGSLLFPPSLIEQIARVSEPNLGPSGVAYTRKVTLGWVIFSLMNAMVSLMTALYGDLALWALYNGLIFYLLIGALIIGEYVFRNYCKIKTS
jgi:uncharacterized membrane protein